jgi:hypothetical protein
MADFAGPGHLRNVDQAFHPGLQLHKGPIVGEAHHFAGNPAGEGIFFLHRGPGIGGELLQPQGNALLFPVEA